MNVSRIIFCCWRPRLSHYTAQWRELSQVLPQRRHIRKKPSLVRSVSANKSWYWPGLDTGCRPSCPGQKQERLPPLPQLSNSTLASSAHSTWVWSILSLRFLTKRRSLLKHLLTWPQPLFHKINREAKGQKVTHGFLQSQSNWARGLALETINS